MAGPNLPVNIDDAYADSLLDPSFKTHQQHHDISHRMLNRFDDSGPTLDGQILKAVSGRWVAGADDGSDAGVAGYINTTNSATQVAVVATVDDHLRGDATGLVELINGIRVGRTNLFTDPSAELTAAGWSSNSSDWSTKSYDTAVKRSDARSVKHTSTGLNAMILSAYDVGGNRPAVVPGQPYTYSVHNLTNVVGCQTRIYVKFRVGGTYGANSFSAWLTCNPGEWMRPSMTIVAPAGADQALVSTDVQKITGSAAAGDVAWSDDALFEAVIFATSRSAPNLVDTARYPIVIGHRGGANIFPEQSMEGLQACADAGFALEVDVYRNASGSLVNCHDATVTRTMTGISGNTVSATDATWRSARLNSPVNGGPTAAPTFFEDVLDRFGGRNLIVPECKTTDATTVNQFIAAIKNRGLQDSVIAQSFDYPTCTTMAAMGLRVCFLTGATITQTPSQLLAAGIKFWGASSTVASGTVASFKAAGVKVFGYTVKTAVEQEALIAKGVDGLFSDDPWISSRQQQYRGNMPTDDYSLGVLWPGARFLQTAATDPETPSPEKVTLAYGGVGLHPDPATPSLRILECPWAQPVGTAFSVHMRGTFSTDSSAGLASSIGGVLWMNTSTPDRPFTDAAVVGQNGYTWTLRRNGQIQIWKYTAGAAAVSLYASTAGVAVADYSAPNDNLGAFDLLFSHSGTTIILASFDSNRDLPQSTVSLADTNTFSNLKFGMRWLTAGFVTGASVTPR